MEQADVCDKLSKEEKDRLLKQTDVCCLTKGSSFRPTNDVAALLETLDFATRKHSTQRRKDPEKTPYINHPIGVAHILASEGGVTNLEVLQVALTGNFGKHVPMYLRLNLTTPS
jgi:(p)ppGpp synthase/HD superfamily hydrolase